MFQSYLLCFECHVFFLESAKRFLKKRLHRSFSDAAHRNDCLTLHCRYLRWGTIWVYERIQLNIININRRFIGRSSRNFKILMFQNSNFHIFFSVRVYCSFERNIVMIVCVWNVV